MRWHTASMIASEGPKLGRQHWFTKRDGGGSGEST